MAVDRETSGDRLARFQDRERITEAINAGVRKALAQHQLAKNPIAVWRGGQVVWIPPEEFPVDPQTAG